MEPHESNKFLRQSYAQKYGRFLHLSSLGFEIVLSIVVGSYIGYKVDQYFLISPYGIALGFLMGVGAAGRRLYRVVKSYMRENMEK